MKSSILAVLKLSQMDVSEKIAKGEYVGQQYKLNGASFPKTAPNTDSQRDEATAALSAAHAAALDGGKQAHLAEKAAEQAFDALFGPYRDWVNQADVAQGDALKIAQLGLDTSKPAARRPGRLPAPVLKPLTGNNTGELAVAAESLPGARAYLVLVAYGDDEPAEADYRYCTSGTRPKFTLTLEAGKIAWVVMVAVGVEGPSLRSAPQKRRVL